MKDPFVFDGEKAKNIGMIGALILQKIDEGIKDEALMIKELYFCKADDIRRTIKELVQKGVLFRQGNTIDVEAIETNLTDIKHQYSEDFEDIWNFYNKEKRNRGSKKKAYERYLRKPFRELPLIIQKEIVNNYRSDVRDVKFMKYFSTFLSEEIYENYAPEICALKTSKGIIEGYLMDNKFFYLNKEGSYSEFDLTGKIEKYKQSGVLKCK